MAKTTTQTKATKVESKTEPVQEPKLLWKRNMDLKECDLGCELLKLGK